MDPLQSIRAEIAKSVSEKYPEPNYDECYVAFLDIMGMKNLLRRDYNDLRKIFNTIESHLEFHKKINIQGASKFISENQIRVTIMSDSIVVSIKKSTEYSLDKLVGFSSSIISDLIDVSDIPIFIRGGISDGNLSHTNFSVFGPGLSSAYRLENEVAMNMRCVFSPSLYETEDFKKSLATNKKIRQDKTDGLYFIDYITAKNKEKIVQYANDCISSEEIEQKVKMKYEWLLNTINDQ